MSAHHHSNFTPAQRVGIWTGVSGTILGCSAWLLAMAGLGGDWLAVALTVALDGVLLVLFARLCLRRGANRLLLLAGLVILVTAHCLAMYWWRFDLWRASSLISPEALQREKMVVTYTVSGMVGLLLMQVGIFYWLQGRSRKNRRRAATR